MRTGVCSDDTDCRESRGQIDFADQGMRVWTADEARMEGPADVDVRREPAHSAQKTPILASTDRRTRVR
jgi:hypothetical protein